MLVSYVGGVWMTPPLNFVPSQEEALPRKPSRAQPGVRAPLCWSQQTPASSHENILNMCPVCCGLHLIQASQVGGAYFVIRTWLEGRAGQGVSLPIPPPKLTNQGLFTA